MSGPGLQERSQGDRPPTPGARQVITLVASREVVERLRARSFLILTGLLVVLIIAVGVITRFSSSDGPDPVELAVAGEVDATFAPTVEEIAEALDREFTITEVADDAAARTALRDGGADVALVVDDGRLLFAGDVDDEIQAVVQQAWSSAETRAALLGAGLGEDEVAEALAPAPLDAVALELNGGDEEADGMAILVGTVAAVLLFVSLQTFGGYVLVGVVEEKSTAVIELLLVRAPADQLLAGKVIGIGVAALLQFAAAVAASLVSLALSGTDVPGEVWSAVPMTLVWFLGGYALYSTLFALAGSLVSRQEDAQAAAAPIMTALMGAYFLVFVFGYVPGSTASRVMSVIPPIAPLLMPMRMAAGAASVLEVVVALVLLAAAIVAAMKLSGRIYAQMLLRRGSRIGWRDALRSEPS